MLSEISGRILVSALFIVAVISLFGAGSSEELFLEKAIHPDKLQSLINPVEEGSGRVSWLGADAATSIKVTSDRYVWLFGDTILGKEENGTRRYSVFIHNTVGVTTKNEAGNFTRIEKHYRKEGGKITGIFNTTKGNYFYWPLVGTELDGSLLIAASKVTTKGVKNFKVLGTTLFTVKNPMHPPEDWKFDKVFLKKKNGVTWGSAITRQNDWLYLFGQKGTGLSSKTLVSKIRVGTAKKGNWDERLYYGDGNWKEGRKAEPLKNLPGTSETTIQHNSFFGWYCLQIPPFGFDIHLYTAAAITGPWKDRGAVYSVPSPWSTEKTKKGKHVFSAYAAKSHPELTDRFNEIVLTYNLNLNPFASDLGGNLQQYIGKEKYEGLYVPQFVTLEFERKSHK